MPRRRDTPCYVEIHRMQVERYPCQMSVKRLRVTRTIEDILDVLMNMRPEDRVWGLKLCQQTGLGTGTIYPALDRLLNAGWIEDWWEEPQPVDRPRRRYYAITADGRAGYQEEVTTRAARRTAWARPALSAGGSA
jgi:PadR family transcriptional regulator, regulatory protein PadR